jgi:hypothetical protein
MPHFPRLVKSERAVLLGMATDPLLFAYVKHFSTESRRPSANDDRFKMRIAVQEGVFELFLILWYNVKANRTR